MAAPSAIWRRVRYRTTALPGPASTVTDHADGVRPLGVLTFHGVSHPATLCPPPATLHFESRQHAGVIIRIPMTLLPEAAQGHPAGIACVLQVSRPSTGLTRERRVILRPAQGPGWRWLQVRVPRGPGDLQIQLSTHVAPGSTSAWAWVACGPPQVDRPRPWREARVLWHTLRDTARTFGWRRALRHAWRGAHPNQPAVDYAAWAARHAASRATLDAQQQDVTTWDHAPHISVITPTCNTRPEWLRECLASLHAQTYPHWRWCIADDASTNDRTRAALDDVARDRRVSMVRLAANQGISRASNAALAQATGDLVVLLDHDDTLAPQALFEVASAFRNDASLELAYSDEDKREPDGTPCDPYFKPDWSPELFMGTMYTCHLTAMRRALVERAGGFREGFEGAQDYDLWLRMTELTARVHHIPQVLYHWRKVPGSTAASQEAKPWARDAGQRALTSAIERRGLAATVTAGARPGHYRVRYRHDEVLISVLMPTCGRGSCPAGQLARVRTAVHSIISTTRPGQVEFVFATEDGSVPAEVLVAAGSAVRTVAVPGPFNFSARINHAAAAASGTLLLLANDDLEAIEPGWLDAMRDYAQLPDIGAVGPRLELPDGRVQHAGLLLGVRGVAAHAFHHARPDHEGYFGSLIGPRNVSAVTGACLLTPAGLFGQVQGLDEALPVDFNDVDYCLRVAAAGRRIVVTPFARLRHHEGASLGGRAPGAEAMRLMQTRWGAVIARDPYYNVNLSRDDVDYRVFDR